MAGSFNVTSTATVRNVSTASIFTISPNPVSSFLHVMFSDKTEPIQVMLTDMAGRIVFSKEYAGSKEVNLDLQLLPNGAYLVSAVQNREVHMQKVQVLH
jgi:hypothetical protein